MKVYTYFSHVPDLNLEHEYKLLLLWRNHWAARGYEPIVLNEYIARQHPLWEEFHGKVSLLPTMNPGGYDLACYYRWLALLQVGGGIMADHDCFIYGDHKWSINTPDTLVCLQGHVPSLVYGSVKAYTGMVNAFMDYVPGEQDMTENMRPHVSDMLIMAMGSAPFQQRFIVKDYGEDGWERAPFVHYSSGSTSKLFNGKRGPRHEVIPTLRKD